MIKRKTKGQEGFVTSYAFWLLGRKWLIALSESKWHAGDKYKRTPIWFSNIGEDISALFIWKLAIGYEKKKRSDEP